MKNFFTTKRICRAAVIAALYAALTFATAPIAYGEVQCRIAEALTVLPLFFPEAIVGLTVGCLIANLIGNGILDIVFGTLATLLASVTTYFIGRAVKNKIAKVALGELPPILYNAIIVPFTFLALTELKEFYFVNALWVGLGQLLAIGVLGSLLYFAVIKLQQRGVSLFIDKEEEAKGVSVLGLVATLGSILPGIGAIVCSMFKGVNALSYVLASLSVLVIVTCAVLQAIKAKKA